MLHSPSDKKLTVGVECARDLPSENRGPPGNHPHWSHFSPYLLKKSNKSIICLIFVVYFPVDSFVKVEILFSNHKLHRRKTKVIPKSCNPEYNEIFEFDIEDDKLPQVMVSLKVKSHWKLRKTRKIGMIKLGYTSDPQEPQYRHWEQVLHHPYMNIETWHAIGKCH